MITLFEEVVSSNRNPCLPQPSSDMLELASLMMLERDGSVLATTGPVRPSDARLRRAQALAGSNGTAVQLAIELITKKLAGQEKVARERLNNLVVAESIAKWAEWPSVGPAA